MKQSEKKMPSGRRSLGYNLLKEYVRFANNVLYYKKAYYLDREKVPDGVPLMIVSNHQNGLNDALNVLFSIRNRKKRKMRFIARADVFMPAVKKALAWLGIYPAYRLSHEGVESLTNNYESFSTAADEITCGGTVVIYPEAGHQDIHWLGKFSLGYLRIAFEAVEKTNFEKEIFVIPCCNHYEDYFHMRKQVVVRYGEMLSLAPYYEKYKESPRATMREVSNVLHERIHDLMLSIDDTENYNAIDYLRNSYGVGYARRNGFNPKRLPEKMQSDKKFFIDLEAAKSKDAAKVQKVYDDTLKVAGVVENNRIADRFFARKSCGAGVFFAGLALLVLLPLFLLSAIPNAAVYYAPRIMTSKIKDRMLHSGFDLAMTVLVSAPLIYLICFVLAGVISGCWLGALAWLVLMPVMFFLFWNYMQWFKLWRSKIRFRRFRRKGALDETANIRETIHSTLDEILG